MKKNKLIALVLIAIAGIILQASCQSEADLNYIRYYTSGKKLYETNCQNCHNNDGSGLAMLYPPLTDTLYLKDHKNQLACIIKNGLKGQIVVGGKTYEGVMPGQAKLSNIEIAQIITYITNSFGNQQGLHDASAVAEDLKNCK